MGFSWLKTGTQPGESLWALMSKFAYLNRPVASDVRRHLGGGARDRYASTQGDLRGLAGLDRGALRRVFQLSDTAVDQATVLGQIPTNFLVAGRSAEEALDFGSTDLTYCAACAEEGYHSAIFQLVWIERCPTHQRPLLKKCKICDSTIPYQLTARLIASPAECKCGYRVLSLERWRKSSTRLNNIDVHSRYTSWKNAIEQLATQPMVELGGVFHQSVMPLAESPLRSFPLLLTQILLGRFKLMSRGLRHVSHTHYHREKYPHQLPATTISVIRHPQVDFNLWRPSLFPDSGLRELALAVINQRFRSTERWLFRLLNTEPKQLRLASRDQPHGALWPLLMNNALVLWQGYWENLLKLDEQRGRSLYGGQEAITNAIANVVSVIESRGVSGSSEYPYDFAGWVLAHVMNSFLWGSFQRVLPFALAATRGQAVAAIYVKELNKSAPLFLLEPIGSDSVVLHRWGYLWRNVPHIGLSDLSYLSDPPAA